MIAGYWEYCPDQLRGGSSHGSARLGSARATVFPGSDLARLVIGSAKSSSAIHWLAEPVDLGSVSA